MNRAIVAVVTSLLLSVAASDRALAQAAVEPRPAAVTVAPAANAHEIRDRLWDLLRQYPPALGEVLQRDPSLLSRPDYLATYPALVAFLAEHPEVERNPAFFLGSYIYHERDPKEAAYEMLGALLAGIAGTAAVVTFLSILVWLIRSVIEHRRWLRLTRVQTEVHTKLMDRFTNNEELLAYIQSPVGRRFLESTPIAIDGEPRPANAPVGRILWSLQAGIVLVALGVGFRFAEKNVLPEVSDGFYVLGVVAIALGVGFALSAVAAYFISTRLGLFAASKS